MTTIPLAEPWFPPAYADAVRDQVLSGFIGPGRATQEFAAALARLVGADRAVATVSGTAPSAPGLASSPAMRSDSAYGASSDDQRFASSG